MPKRSKVQFAQASKANSALVKEVLRRAKQSENAKIETKYIDLILSASTVSNAMSINLLNGITQGTTATNRLGETVRSVRISYNLQFVGADATNFVRFLLVVDHQCNGATFAAADLLANQPDPFAFRFMDNIARFSVLCDRDIDLTLTGPDAVHIRGNVKTKAISFYTGAANTIANIKTNGIFAVFISDSGAVSHPTVSGDIRYFYKDA
jgi:hypothetical protein